MTMPKKHGGRPRRYIGLHPNQEVKMTARRSSPPPPRLFYPCQILSTPPPPSDAGLTQIIKTPVPTAAGLFFARSLYPNSEAPPNSMAPVHAPYRNAFGMQPPEKDADGRWVWSYAHPTLGRQYTYNNPTISQNPVKPSLQLQMPPFDKIDKGASSASSSSSFQPNAFTKFTKITKKAGGKRKPRTKRRCRTSLWL